jgi:hypothetical protein
MSILKKDFTVIRGEEFRIQLTVTIDGSSDLTGYVPAGQLRKLPEATEVAKNFTFEPSTLGIGGQFDIVLSQTDTAALGGTEYSYDIRLTKTKPIYVLKGKLQLITPTTREP